MTQRVLITGCSSGFGRLAATSLAAAGHRVFATMRDIAGKNAAAARDLEAADPRVRVLELDVNDEASVDAAVKAAVDAAGGLDVVINNAGIAGLGFIEGYTVDRLRQVFETNVFGVHRVCRAALPVLRESGAGLLVFVSSVMGRVVVPCTGAYTASKFALEALAETYSYELAPLGIDVTILEPGTHPTKIGENMAPWGPDDAARLSSYDTASAIPAAVQESIVQVLSAPEPPDSGAVARALVELVAAPQGERPRRRVIDELSGAGAEAINAISAECQGQLLAHLGLTDTCKS
jgi:NAD(P)-dependent dehydrogenase (short-subunit alcohol dehydrogenase family)